VEVYQHLRLAGFQKSLEAVIEMRRLDGFKIVSQLVSEQNTRK